MYISLSLSIYIYIYIYIYISGGTTCTPLLVPRAFLQKQRFSSTFVTTSISTHVVLTCTVLC